MMMMMTMMRVPPGSRQSHSRITAHGNQIASFVCSFAESVPCGAVVGVIAERTQSVSFLHHLFRSNSLSGNEDSAILFLPTMGGLFCLDNENIVEVRGGERWREVVGSGGRLWEVPCGSSEQAPAIVLRVLSP